MITPSTEHVDVFRIDLRQPAEQVDALAALLSIDEQHRADRLRISSKRREFIVTRANLRRLLSQCLNTDPANLHIQTEMHGRPVLDARIDGEPLRFNVTHSGDVSLIAVTLRDDVGIDIEHVTRRSQFERLTERYFSQAEVAQYRQVDPASRRQAFFHGWTRKEALLKAVGSGLTLGLGSFDVELRPDQPPALLDARCPELQRSKWALTDVAVDENYQAAVAVRRPRCVLRLHR